MLYVLLSLAFIILKFHHSFAKENFNIVDFPACRLKKSSNDIGCDKGESLQICEDISMKSSLIVIGDVHGENDGMKELLYTSNITTDYSTCSWSNKDVTLVQMGDIVDRGYQALEAWECLNELQDTIPNHSTMVRILGNHELWWLQGLYHMRNKRTDSRENIEKIVLDLKKRIVDGKIVAAYVHKINGVSVLFIHAGLRPSMLEYLKNKLEVLSAESIADYMNKILVEHTINCPGFGYTCEYSDEIFAAGPDRGGGGIGGPLWTDFSVLETADENLAFPSDMIQVVGHSVAECYREYYGHNDHPSLDMVGCSKGLIRSTAHMGAVCVDGGMYLGARAYLEINSQGSFIAHEMDGASSDWRTRDLNGIVCGLEN